MASLRHLQHRSIIFSPTAAIATSDTPQVGRSRLSRLRFGATPRRPPAVQMMDNFGNAFTLQTTEQSSIAERRRNRRGTLDVGVAHVEHRDAWEQYLLNHDGFFEEQADEVRQAVSEAISEDYLLVYPGLVTFQTVDFGAEQQPRSMLAKVTDGQPVSPRTKPSRRKMNSREMPLSLRTREMDHRLDQYESKGRAYSLADLEPTDLEETGLGLRHERAAARPVRSFMQAIGSVVKDLVCLRS
ncbi:hypothetical protein LTR85_011725 [Meristemomyces frigidus]|nr:hypothetical protein LTR85_011725 [Meristemomyces frigidus]